MSSHHSKVIQKSFHHQEVTPKSFWCHPCHSTVILVILLSFRHFPSFGIIPSSEWHNYHFRMIWNDFCPQSAGMTGLALEWLDWAQNDGMGESSGEAILIPSLAFDVIPSFRSHSGMQFQWGLASNDGGMTPVEGPKLDTFPSFRSNTLF